MTVATPGYLHVQHVERIPGPNSVTRTPTGHSDTALTNLNPLSSSSWSWSSSSSSSSVVESSSRGDGDSKLFKIPRQISCTFKFILDSHHMPDQNFDFPELWFSKPTTWSPYAPEGFSDSDFASRGGRRVTRFTGHCPVCSLDLRKILSASKADDSADSAAGQVSESSIALWLMFFFLYLLSGVAFLLDASGCWIDWVTGLDSGLVWIWIT